MRDWFPLIPSFCCFPGSQDSDLMWGRDGTHLEAIKQLLLPCEFLLSCLDRSPELPPRSPRPLLPEGVGPLLRCL